MASRPFDLEGIVDQVIWLDDVDSTNQYLSTSELPGSALVLSWNQTKGKGRLGRSWSATANKTLAVSLQLWPDVLPDALTPEWLGALSLLTAASLASTSRAHLSDPVRIKWPNDVMVGGKKVAGILGDIPGPGRVIVGVGVNVWLDAAELPTDSATSLNLHGVSRDTQVESIVRGLVTTLRQVLLEAKGGMSAELLAWVSEQMDTLGHIVRVDFPNGSSREGEALGLERDGRLQVRFSDNGEVRSIDAADVWHLRPVE